MKFFTTRKKRKELKEVLRYAKHTRQMHEDLVDPEELVALKRLEKEGRSIRKTGDIDRMETVGNKLVAICEKLAPPRRHAKFRENIEVLFVAIAAAMAIRAYFFQPFKIPTGSMQPTLYGITLQKESTLPMTNPLFKAANFLFFGEQGGPVPKAKANGFIRMARDWKGNILPYYQPNPDQTLTIYIGNVPHKISSKLYYDNFLRIGEPIQIGEPVARPSIKKGGDYILVNRLKYNFSLPKRGDIVVFDTRELTHPQVRKNAYYIKRMVGLPGETISLAPKDFLVNGKKPTDPRFDKIFENENYSGYQFGNSTKQTLLGNAENNIPLSDDEYLFFGDNTYHSLDGRYFGAVNRRQIFGPAFFVCWPFDRAGFAEISH